MEDLIGYNQLIEDSMRDVVYKVLKKIEKEGLRGRHHFVISFDVDHPAVVIPKSLREKFPKEMTIILQHQFQGLRVEKEQFKVSLSFSGNYEKLTIPYNAITSFVDPEVSFGLKFNRHVQELREDEEQAERQEPFDLSKKVVSLDAFRNKRDNQDN